MSFASPCLDIQYDYVLNTLVGIQKGKPNLLKDVLFSFPKELLLIFFASTALVALQICQPFLIQETVNFLASPSASQNIGYGLVGGFFCVAAGTAVSPFHKRGNLPLADADDASW